MYLFLFGTKHGETEVYVIAKTQVRARELMKGDIYCQGSGWRCVREFKLADDVAEEVYRVYLN